MSWLAITKLTSPMNDGDCEMCHEGHGDAGFVMAMATAMAMVCGDDGNDGHDHDGAHREQKSIVWGGGGSLLDFRWLEHAAKPWSVVRVEDVVLHVFVQHHLK